jgi:hypothetical protein
LQLTLSDKRVVEFTHATQDDASAIVELYHKVYSGKYTLEEVSSPETIAKNVEDATYFWILARCEGMVVGSVIFAIDAVNKLGKSYAAVILKEFRGHDLMRIMVKFSIQMLTEKTRVCDVIYATTRTVNYAPQMVLESLNFRSAGIFPNVRKVEAFETHGLAVYLGANALINRRKNPRLVEEVHDFYKILQGDLNLEDAEIVELESKDPRKMGKQINFSLCRDLKEIDAKLFEYQDQDLMERIFFPFIEPNILFSSTDGTADFFVNFNPLDGSGVVLGFRYSGTNLRQCLMWFCEEASKTGMRYIEMLISAFRPERQRLVLDAKFLPCAYFPAIRMSDEGLREDYLIFSRSFEKLDFMDLHLRGSNRRFLDAFMKSWYELLVRCQPNFDEEWRLG